MAAGASPFSALGGKDGASAFGSPGKAPLSSFASAKSGTASTSTISAGPKLSFGGGASAASPFSGLPKNTNGFGSGAGGLGTSGFSSLGGSKPLSSFASGGGAKPFSNSKPARPFGAPESDAENSNDDSNADDDDENDAANGENERAESPEKESEERKKAKLQRSTFLFILKLISPPQTQTDHLFVVEVDTGETGDATLISVRSKMFLHEPDAGWKERGAGMLKINVPQACVEFEDNGEVKPGSFDASALDDDDEEGGAGGTVPKVARLVMRQDQTHRVILNTPILPIMKFQEKETLKSSSVKSVLFTAFEGPEAKPITVTMRVS